MLAGGASWLTSAFILLIPVFINGWKEFGYNESSGFYLSLVLVLISRGQYFHASSTKILKRNFEVLSISFSQGPAPPLTTLIGPSCSGDLLIITSRPTSESSSKELNLSSILNQTWTFTDLSLTASPLPSPV